MTSETRSEEALQLLPWSQGMLFPYAPSQTISSQAAAQTISDNVE